MTRCEGDDKAIIGSGASVPEEEEAVGSVSFEDDATDGPLSRAGKSIDARF